MGTNASPVSVKEISTNVAVMQDLVELNGTFTLTEDQSKFQCRMVLRTVWFDTLNHGFSGTAKKTDPHTNRKPQAVTTRPDWQSNKK